MSGPTGKPAWKRLGELSRALDGNGLPRLVLEDPDRHRRYTVRLDGLLYDYSRQSIDDDVFAELIRLAEQQDVGGWRDRMYAGEAVNVTEKRAAMHMALRANHGDIWKHAGESLTETILGERARCYAFADAVREGRIRGATGARFTDVVEIGIGGSHLGPALLCDALAPWADPGVRVHFVSNADGADLSRTLSRCRPESTLITVASKTFTTQETLLNANSARQWLVDACGNAGVEKHFVAVTAAIDKALEFGVPQEQVFAFWEWVGGRFSLWGAIGLPAMISIGPRRFDELLAGARDIDLHFQTAPLAENVPVLMGMIGVWNRNFRGAASHAVLPYAEMLRLLPAYLQQLVMESLGKCVDRNNAHVDYDTAPVVWGMQGTQGQHAFYQLLHQGRDTIGIDFICFREPVEGPKEHHPTVLANVVAQAEALLIGSRGAEAFRDCAGGRASTVIVFDRLDPYNLGRLIALYEHQVFVQSIVWNMNAFDQWGVELGKKLGKPLLEELKGGTREGHDPSTTGLVDYLLKR